MSVTLRDDPGWYCACKCRSWNGQASANFASAPSTAAGLSIAYGGLVAAFSRRQNQEGHLGESRAKSVTHSYKRRSNTT